MLHDKEAEMRYRSGYYNACDGNGWQKQTTTLSPEDSEKRDAEALESHALLVLDILQSLP